MRDDELASPVAVPRRPLRLLLGVSSAVMVLLCMGTNVWGTAGAAVAPIAATFFLTGNQPSTSANSAKVIEFSRSHRVAETTSVFVIVLAAIAFTFVPRWCSRVLRNRTA